MRKLAPLAFAALCSCAPQKEIARIPPVVDIPGRQMAVSERTLSVFRPGKQKSRGECANISYLLDSLSQECPTDCAAMGVPRMLFPSSTARLLSGQSILAGDYILLAEVGSYLLKGRVSMRVGAIDADGVEFRFGLDTWVDDADLARVKATPGEKQEFVKTHTYSIEGVFFVDFDGWRSHEAFLLESLQPGRLSVGRGASPDTAIIRYDAVTPCG